jgi:hypothetical protein
MSVFETPVMVSMVPWVGKFSGCCRGGFCSALTWFALVLFGVVYVICGWAGDRLIVELAEVEDGWYWCSGMAGNMLEIGYGYFGMLVLDNARGRMGSVAGCVEPTAWCG